MSGAPDTMTAADYAEPLKGLPAGVWTFRRVFVFALTLIAMALVWRIIELAPPAYLAAIAKWLIGLVGLLVVVYTIGPTAEHIVRLGKVVEALSPFRKGGAS